MVGRQILSQDAFDEAVASNVEDFGMEEDEAVQSAVEEFTLQGLDLAGVIKRGPVARQTHPVKGLLSQLQKAFAAKDQASTDRALRDLRELLSGQKGDELADTLAVAAAEEAVGELLRVVEAPLGSSQEQLALRVLQAVLGNSKSRSLFASSAGASIVLRSLQARAEEMEIFQAAAEAAEAAAVACEENKTAFVDGGIGPPFVVALDGVKSTPEAIRAMSKVVRRLTTADDDRPTVSRAFQNSRTLSKDGLHLAFLKALSRQEVPPQELTAACCSAIKKLAANDELCCQISEAGGVELALKALRQNRDSAQVVSAACALLRQMAGSDAIKARIMDAGGLELAADILEAQAGSASAMEQALGLVAALTLRFPEAASKAVEAGLADATLHVRGLPTADQVMGVLRQQWVQRQGCMALRNLVARNPEARPLLSEKGAEEALRRAKLDFPEACRDVGSAALRDLGVEDYNS